MFKPITNGNLTTTAMAASAGSVLQTSVGANLNQQPASAFVPTPAPMQALALPAQVAQPSALMRSVAFVKKGFEPVRTFFGDSAAMFRDLFRFPDAGMFSVQLLAGADAPLPIMAFSDKDDYSTPNIPSSTAFSGETRGRIFETSALDAAKQELLKALSEKTKGNLRNVDAALEVMRLLPEPLQTRNLRIAIKMAGWIEVTNPAIAAALLIGTEADKATYRGDMVVLDVLRNVVLLEGLKCNWSKKDQPGNYRGLVISASNSIAEALLLAAADMVELENAPIKPEEVSAETTETAKRAFYGTSLILKSIGMPDEGSRLEDIGFLHMDPEKHQQVEEMLAAQSGMDRVNALRKLRGVAADIDQLLDILEIRHRVKNRVKSAASADKKAAAKGPGANIDAQAMRIVVSPNTSDADYSSLTESQKRSHAEAMCFDVFDEISDHLTSQGWKEVRSLFDNYITSPKPNGYQSLHVYFLDPTRTFLVEMQIRTEDMDYTAEFGSAAHGDYKNREKTSSTAPKEVQSTLDVYLQKKESLASDGVQYPIDEESGNIIKLVTGSSNRKPTVLDFAFATDIASGFAASFGTVNGTKAKVGQEIVSGDRVKIFRGRNEHARVRADMAGTAFAQALLQLRAQGLVDTLILDEMAFTIEAGKKTFREILTKIEGDLRKYDKLFEHGKPTFKYSMKRLYNKLGFQSEEHLYIALAALPDSPKRTEFQSIIEEKILMNSVLYTTAAYGHITTLEVMYVSEPGVLAEMLAGFRRNGLKIRAAEKKKLPKSRYSFGRFNLASGSAGGTSSFTDGLEDLYRHTYPEIIAQQRTIGLKISHDDDAHNESIIDETIKAILDSGFSVNSFSFPLGKEKFTLQIQTPRRHTAKALEQLEERLNAIRGVRNIFVNN